MSNLPEGAENDPRAPWNEPNLCRYCDYDILCDIYEEHIVKEIELQQMEFDSEEDYMEFLQEEMDVLLSEQGLCPQCAKEEYYDYDDRD